MGWGFRKSIKIFKGLNLNFSKNGPSISVGPQGFKVNVGKKGVRTTVSKNGFRYSRFKKWDKK